MTRRFAKVLEEEIEEASFYPSDLVNTKTTIPLRVGEGRWIYTSTLRVSVDIHHYSPSLRGIVEYCLLFTTKFSSVRQFEFQNHIELFLTSLYERRESGSKI